MSARDILLQIAQVLTTILLAPLIQGVILQFEERVQRAQGPGLFQPYRDLWKLFRNRSTADGIMAILRGPGRRLHVHARRTATC
jgi:formate hydrogenlyase subunit 4